MHNLLGLIDFTKDTFDFNSASQTITNQKYNYNNTTFIITYIGKLYNTNELYNDLITDNFSLHNKDEEILLYGFIKYGYNIIKKLNGAFAFSIWDDSKKELFFARDHFGIKPFYYSQINTSFIFSSKIENLFAFPELTPILDKQGINELFGLGPARTPGITLFKNINELKPAHYGIYNKHGLFLQKYWELESKPHTDSLGTTCEKVRNLLEESIKNQLVTNRPICTFLSGGLDSSIITFYATNYCKEHNLPPLETYSVDYIDNDKNFVKNDFQPNSDTFFINLMLQKVNVNHNTIMLDTPELANSLEDAMLAREFPGMADVDSSLLLFCKNVISNSSIALTGECADEIFGGYPWFFKESPLSSGTFPWSSALTERQNLLNPYISEQTNLKEYVNYRFNESLNKVKILETDSFETAEKRKISYLTINWFMQTLLSRSDRIATYNNFEIRVPFCDYKLAEYVWNIPWELKSLNGREKGLLRYIMKDYLPDQIIDRKKSPYPKTCNPTYLAKVKEMLNEIIINPNSPINSLINHKYVLEIIESNGNSFTKPWFGQLMTGPQLMAYLIQVNMWLEKYQPKISLN